MPAFKVDDLVWIHNRQNGLWDIPATVVEVREDGRSFYVQPDKGTKKLRNWRYLIKRIPQEAGSAVAAADAGADIDIESESESAPTAGPRRSPRLATQKKVTFTTKVRHQSHVIRPQQLPDLDRKKVRVEWFARVVRSATNNGRYKHKA